MKDTEEKSQIQEWGLRLPNGTVQWGSWRGLHFSTTAERLTALATLVKTLEDAGLVASESIKEYGWCTRTAEIVYLNDVEIVSIDDPHALGVTLELPTTEKDDEK